MPKIEYPAYFNNGATRGLKVKEDIEHREGYLYVPYKIIISTDKAENDEVIKKILKDHKEVFEHS